MEGNSDSDAAEPSVAPFVPQQSDSPKVMALFLLYSMAMFSIPFMAFFGTKYTLKHSFHVEGFASTAWSVVAAVVVVNVIILSYACRGYEETREAYEERNEAEKSASDTDAKKNE